MAQTAAYSGLRWGELTALSIAQIDLAARVITVDRKVVEVAGHLYVERQRCFSLVSRGSMWCCCGSSEGCP